MTRTYPILAVALWLLLPAAGLAAARVLAGDPVRGAGLYRLHCAACHGPAGRGDGPLAAQLRAPAPTDLRDVAFLLQRSDEQLHTAIAQGGLGTKRSFTMPAFAGQIAPLDLWDLVAHLRQGQPMISDYFPTGARYTARTFTLEGDSLKRLEPLLGKLEGQDSRIVLATVFGGEKGAQDEPAYVPQDPRLLDSLKPKQKQGYLSFGEVTIPGVGAVPVTLALEKDGTIKAVRPELAGLTEPDRATAQRLLAGYEGQNGRKVPYEDLKTPQAAARPKDKKEKKPAKKVDEPKEAPEVARSLSRTYLRALEAATLFDKEERERHWAD